MPLRRKTFPPCVPGSIFTLAFPFTVGISAVVPRAASGKLTYRSYSKLFDDIEYIVDKAKVVKIQNKSNRCLYIDIDKALKAGVDLEGFIGVQEKDTSNLILEEEAA